MNNLLVAATIIEKPTTRKPTIYVVNSLPAISISLYRLTNRSKRLLSL